MAYGYAKAPSDYRSQGILSLLENMATPKSGRVSDEEMRYFMDTDTGTEFDPLKKPTRNPAYNETMASLIRNDGSTMSQQEFAHMAQQEANQRASMAGVGIDPNMTTGLSSQELLSKFSQILSTVSTEEQVPVVRNFSRLDDDGKMRMMAEVVANPALIRGYQMQDEIPYSKNLGF